MSKLLQVTIALLIGMIISSTAYAEEFLLGDETKGVTLKANEADLNIRVRLQPRIDYGDIIKSQDGKSYTSDKDFYLRRIRLEMSGALLVKTLKYNLTLTGDKWDKAGNTNEIGVQYAYLEWEMDDAFALISGKEKLPYSRVSLTSSSKQLSIERPVSTEAAKKLFGKTEAYYQPKIAAKGKFLEGVIGYEAAFADGWQNGESIQTGLTVFKASPFYVARVELSPPGWTEPKKSDANLGKGKHLVLGLDYAAQTGIEYKENNYKEDRALAGIDLSGHYEGLTFQLEYNAWNVKFTDPSKKEQTPNGWYAQAGYFIDGPMIEPVIRYEVYDQDSNSSNKKETDTTIGVNWYLKGHSLKWGLNWVHSEYEKSNSNWLANSDKKDVYQLQAQIYF
ncbi:MAG: hypothetical protein A3G39_09485 [Deltaproteobacteria bacterium RIFCSPLOWO2_12_FULL_43_16]|nr:MAG: hypothetical protein A3D30_02950 [Deltaproteobacteria bacterium RIFCSPHIGHO2_02_FULL_43_33]OGQ59102.1 MAG: hypothetical protein A3G39_09485 [Deltaproteobacteria bacterium RIFCSPLOWO2_12_FULL_43_16]HBR17188.1 hypothetical protein [Deltaproteobacteria bacterium]